MKHFALFLAATFLAVSMHAQTAPTTSPASIEELKPMTPAQSWPERFAFPHDRIEVVTIAEPTRRQSCHLKSVTADNITCRLGKSHHDTAYRRTEIAALIDPPNHSDRFAIAIYWAVAAVALAASFFVPLAASITLRVITYAALYGSAWGDGADHSDDRYLYRAPAVAPAP